MRSIRIGIGFSMVLLGLGATTSQAQVDSTIASTSSKPDRGGRVIYTTNEFGVSIEKALGFTWTPPNSEIGDLITFRLEGLNDDVSEANWNFGETGCNGASATEQCTPSLFNDCQAVTFKFASGGPKNVSVSVTLAGGGSASAGPTTVNVSYSGSCGPGGGDETCTNVLLEPGFEGGSGSEWSESSSNGYFLITMNRPRSGSFSAWLGGFENEDSSVFQNPEINSSATSATLQYWYWIESVESGCSSDYGGVRVNEQVARGHDYDLCAHTETDGFIQSDIVDLLPLAGTNPKIEFFASVDDFGVSSFFVDDVVLEVCQPGAPSDHIFTDGFESGDISNWSASSP